MKIPVIRAVIDRRLLLNYRVAPDVLAALLPAPFRPKLHGGFGVVGVCLIRLREVRPRPLPSWLGLSSENAAHRIAVEWDEMGVIREGVYIPRRDTNSRVNTLVGGRLFPGLHSYARSTVRETDTHFEVALRSVDGLLLVDVVADVVPELPQTSIFSSLADASAFFQAGGVGYSATSDPRRFHGIELRCHTWQVEPISVSSLRSSWFDDRRVFPAGSIEFDCALLMRRIEHDWHGKPDLCCSVEEGPKAPLQPTSVGGD